MNYFYLILCLFVNISFSQSLLNRFLVPLYVESEFSYGHDDNYLKLSLPEQKSNLEHRLGDSKKIDSNIFKNRINILYIPYIFHDHETKFNFSIMTSNYSESNLKSYNNYHFRFSQHLAPYTWLRFTYGYTPSFYIKSYSQTDPYIIYDFVENDYMPTLFSSEKIGIEFSAPIPYLNKTYVSVRYLFESQYYNADFTEFDLEINSYYFKIRKKLFTYFNMSIAYMKSQADNIAYMNGLLSTSDKDRSYEQEKLYVSFSIQKFYLFGRKMSMGFYSNLESRNFSSNLKEDGLHFQRSHNDMALNYWVRRHLGNYVDIKIRAANRTRNTSSPYYTEGIAVSEFKSFSKFEVWLSIILKMELNVY